VIILSDIDNFKKINDTFGNETGDITLQNISEHLIETITKFQNESNFNTNISLYRFGGDEFIVLFENISNLDYIANFVRILHKSFNNKKFDVLGRNFIFSLSTGISLYPEDGNNSELLLKRAEIAMYEIKKYGGNGFHFYQSGMDSIIASYLEMENNLRIAVERQEFILYYQPKVNAYSHEIIGLEALIRWIHPDKGIISPGEFIPLAEKMGLISHIGEIVLKIACFDIFHLKKNGVSVVPVAVNISSGQFAKKGFLETILSILKETNLPPQLLQIEITESTFLENLNEKIKIFEDIRQEGIKIFIDDFGTGYSSLSYLHKLPVSGLKIDRSFIKDLSFNPESKLITRSIIALAQSLNISVVAEGVETTEHLNILKSLGCDEIQGYLFSKPLHPDLLPDFLNKKIIKI
jgi:diguanylate cyclase (GGDEF)-like protein